MKKMTYMSLVALLSFALFPHLTSDGPVSPVAEAQGKIKIAVLDKMPKAQSAERFSVLYPELSKKFRESFNADGRFELIPQAEVERAFESATKGRERIDLDDVSLLRKIGREAGAEVVFSSYYYEMGGHAMPMHANNVLMLVWVNTDGIVKLDKEYSRILSNDELVSSDALVFKELLEKAETYLP
jgi:hypothetical protein